jgi:hypothetical protein
VWIACEEKRMRNRCLALAVFLIVTSAAYGHVGSPDVYLDGQAGPYHILLTVTPPAMVPGIARVQARVVSGNVTGITVEPVYVNGKDQGFPPTPDAMQSAPGDPQWFTGNVWLMQSGAWDVRVEVSGPQGTARMAVPVPAYARRILPMQRMLAILLFGLMIFLSIGIVSIAGAAAREGVLLPGTSPVTKNQRSGRIAMALAAIVVVTMLALGNWWWNVQAADLKHTMLYNAPPLQVSFNGADQLNLRMEEDFWHKTRKAEWSMDLIPDHGHLMHAFLVRVPGMDHFYHLHPEQANDGSFALQLPTVPAGKYKVFADIVRGTGFPETMVSEIDLPDVAGKPFAGDDSGVAATALGNTASGNASALSGGERMIWDQDTRPLKAGELTWFRFHIEDAQHITISDLEPYMGMAGHAEFVKSDLSVFAHIHPAGSVSMASLMIAQKDSGLPMDHSSMSAVPVEVSFPYAFPQPGEYRLFVQLKRHGEIETGVFDAQVAK